MDQTIALKIGLFLPVSLGITLYVLSKSLRKIMPVVVIFTVQLELKNYECINEQEMTLPVISKS